MPEAIPSSIDQLIIAEKPSVMRLIAAAAGGPDKGIGFITCPHGVVVTHCVGHLLELCPPEHYSADGRSRPAWPLFPRHYDKEAKKDTKKQLTLIGKLLRVAKSAVNAGDPDREGQYLVDEVLAWHKYKGPVRRYLTAAMDDRSVRQALNNLQDNAAHLAAGQAAYARSVADWLVGMNMSNLAAPAVGHRLAMGRVQTPTLQLIGERCERIENFTVQTYYGAQARFHTLRGDYDAKLELPTEWLSADGYLTDQSRITALLTQLQGQSGRITDFKKELSSTPPPLCHTLTTLQREASRRHKLSAKQTLEAAQSLYEKKLTSYPRSSCAYLPTSQREDVPTVIAAIKTAFAELADHQSDPQRATQLFNDKKVAEEAHTAIVPTIQDLSTPAMQSVLSALSDRERKVYALICRRYLACFMPDYTCYKLRVSTEVEQYHFSSAGTRPVNVGWKALYAAASGTKDDDEGDEAQSEEQDIPDTLEIGLRADLISLAQTSGRTKPPAYFTDGTLIDAMEHPARYVEDKKEQAVLREIGGIGTPATRAAIIESLKKHQFVTVPGGKYHITQLGRTVLKVAPAALKSPSLTARNEQQLTMVARGALRAEDFIAAQVRQIEEDYMPEMANLEDSRPKCPKCGSILYHNPASERNGRKYAANFHCGNKECSAYFDVAADGGVGAEQTKGGGEKCPACGADKCRRYPDKFHPGQYRWWCSACKAAFADDNGKIGAAHVAARRHACPKCQSTRVFFNEKNDKWPQQDNFRCADCGTYFEAPRGRDGGPGNELKRQ